VAAIDRQAFPCPRVDAFVSLPGDSPDLPWPFSSVVEGKGNPRISPANLIENIAGAIKCIRSFLEQPKAAQVRFLRSGMKDGTI
jgi:hypothetical protein